jgi:hypothetical protein
MSLVEQNDMRNGTKFESEDLDGRNIFGDLLIDRNCHKI